MKGSVVSYVGFLGATYGAMLGFSNLIVKGVYYVFRVIPIQSGGVC